MYIFLIKILVDCRELWPQKITLMTQFSFKNTFLILCRGMKILFLFNNILINLISNTFYVHINYRVEQIELNKIK